MQAGLNACLKPWGSTRQFGRYGVFRRGVQRDSERRCVKTLVLRRCSHGSWLDAGRSERLFLLRPFVRKFLCDLSCGSFFATYLADVFIATYRAEVFLRPFVRKFFCDLSCGSFFATFRAKGMLKHLS
jgi:hypothetical protein